MLRTVVEIWPQANVIYTLSVWLSLLVNRWNTTASCLINVCISHWALVVSLNISFAVCGIELVVHELLACTWLNGINPFIVLVFQDLHYCWQILVMSGPHDNGDDQDHDCDYNTRRDRSCNDCTWSASRAFKESAISRGVPWGGRFAYRNQVGNMHAQKLSGVVCSASFLKKKKNTTVIKKFSQAANTWREDCTQTVSQKLIEFLQSSFNYNYKELKGQCHDIQWFFTQFLLEQNGGCSRKRRGDQTWKLGSGHAPWQPGHLRWLLTVTVQSTYYKSSKSCTPSLVEGDRQHFCFQATRPE